MSLRDFLRTALGGTPPAPPVPPPTPDTDPAEAVRSDKHVLLGVPVWFLNERPDIDTAHLIARFTECLQLIQDYMPHNARRLRSDLSKIWVKRWPNRGIFFHASRTMIIDTTFVVNPSFVPAQVAATILHEGVHARVTAMGVDRAHVNAADEERMARRAEIEFGRRVPGGEPVVQRALEILGMQDHEVAPGIDLRVADARLRELRAREVGDAG
jgi:hypothetical protein